MRAVVLPVASNDIEQDKDRDPRTKVTGSGVYAAAVLKALVDYGSYDRYYVMVGPEWASKGGAQWGDRVKLLSVEALPEFNATTDEVVLFAAQPALHVLAPWRRVIGVPRAPLVGIIHSMHTRLFFMQLMRLLLTGDMQPYDALICSSEAGKLVVEKGVSQIASQFQRMYGISAEFQPQRPVIPLGVRVSDFETSVKARGRSSFGFTGDDVVFLYLGRFSTIDKADLAPMVLAFCLNVVRRCSTARLVLAGDDSAHNLGPDLRAMAGELGCGDRVSVITNLSKKEKAELLGAADVFVSPSDNIQETFGITLIEAMAAGLPVLASDWNGYKDTVVHGRTGFLTPTYIQTMNMSSRVALATLYPQSGLLAARTVVDTDRWADYAIRLALNPGLRQSMGAQARALALEKYDWPVIIRRYEDLWRELSARAKKAPIASPRCGEMLFDEMTFESLFDHYPTGSLSGHTLSTKPEAADLILKRGVISHLCQPPSVFESRIFTAVLAACANWESSTAEEIVAATERLYRIPEGRVRVHLARLIKFGLVSIGGDRSCKNSRENEAERDLELPPVR